MTIQQWSIGRPATWLEVVRSARESRGRVQVHPIQGGGSGPVAVSLASRLMCSNDGRITVFEDLAAASRFLSLAGVRKWAVGAALQGAANLPPGTEQLRLRGGRLCS